MNLPGDGFHPLRGDRKGTYAVSVSGNWRMTFRFEGEHAVAVDLEDTTDANPERPQAQAHAPRRGAAGGRAACPAYDADRVAHRLGVSRLTVSELLLEKRGLSPEIAARIGRLLDTTPESRLRMQEAWICGRCTNTPKSSPRFNLLRQPSDHA